MRNMKFGQRLKQYRLRAGLTQKQVYQRTKLSAGFLSDVENGKRSVSASTLKSLADVLGVTMDHLFTGR